MLLLALLFLVVGSDKGYTIKRLWQKDSKDTVISRWKLSVFQLQIFIVYFYGGLAKLNGDWFTGEPMRSILGDSYPGNEFLTSEAAAYFFSYGGVMFDLLIIPLLLWKRTRWLAIGLLVFFHGSNLFMHNIGIFPILMLATTVLFLPFATAKQIPTKQKSLSYFTIAAISVYFIIQLVVPFRHLAIPGEVLWTEEGTRFSWRMIPSAKRYNFSFYVNDVVYDQKIKIGVAKFLEPHQIEMMGVYPDIIPQFAGHLGREARKQGVQSIEVFCHFWVGLNGRPVQRLLVPTKNLIIVRSSPFSHSDWLLPLYPPKYD